MTLSTNEMCTCVENMVVWSVHGIHSSPLDSHWAPLITHHGSVDIHTGLLDTQWSTGYPPHIDLLHTHSSPLITHRGQLDTLWSSDAHQFTRHHVVTWIPNPVVHWISTMVSWIPTAVQWTVRKANWQHFYIQQTVQCQAVTMTRSWTRVEEAGGSFQIKLST